MPEGDTIFVAAARLHTALASQTILSAQGAGVHRPGADVIGRKVQAVVPHGKNLLVKLDGEITIRTHLRMHGSWHLYRPGEKWRRAPHRARLVLTTADWVAVCFDAPVVEVLRASDAMRRLSRLGPDLLADTFDIDHVVSRSASLDHLTIGEALLHQELVAGIGNVYKSEILFCEKQSPFTLLEQLAPGVLAHIVLGAQALMMRNLEGHRRRTRSGREPLWVYGRSGLPCLQCQARIRMKRQGTDGRSTYYCPACQSVASER